MSRLGYIITYMVCLVLWCSKLHTKINLNKTEAEYIALRQVVCEVISFRSPMKEISLFFDIYLPNPEVFCKVFEENQSCIAVSESFFFTENKIYRYYVSSFPKFLT